MISQSDISGDGVSTHYFIRDAQGNVRVLLDEAGNISDKFVWDAWGNLLSRTGTTFTNMSFHGEHRDWTTG
jgi:YD repeat-containing protein